MLTGTVDGTGAPDGVGTDDHRGARACKGQPGVQAAGDDVRESVAPRVGAGGACCADERDESWDAVDW